MAIDIKDIITGAAPIGFTGSQGAGFTGSQGVIGFTGSKGDLGFTGSQGDIGFTGSQGTGFTGSQGDIGFVGSQGPAGGFTGSQGDTGFTGSQGPTNIPENSQSAGYTLQAADVGKFINITSGNVTIPEDIFSSGDIITVYNNSTSVIDIIQGSSTVMRLAGTSTTGTRSLSQRGLCSILCVDTNEFAVSGAGLF